jgi:hypothetical protein
MSVPLRPPTGRPQGPAHRDDAPSCTVTRRGTAAVTEAVASVDRFVSPDTERAREPGREGPTPLVSQDGSGTPSPRTIARSAVGGFGTAIGCHDCDYVVRVDDVAARVTSKRKMRSKLKSVKAEMRTRMHLPIPEQGRWLARVLQGHYNYYAVPDNSEAMRGFREQAIRHWHHTLRRRSQKDQITWKRTRHLAERWLAQPRILHPWPAVRFDAKTQGRSPVR